jgi:formate--tetrahydrofolate ligase
VAHNAGLRPIRDVTDELGLDPNDVTVWGDGKAKVSLDALDRSPPSGRLILVSAMTPTPAGEGKTTTAIGLAQGLSRVGARACAVLREPSLGPTFGLKGGATGGGRAVVEPSDDINLHFTGDFHAITSAHNLLAALLDNHLHRRNRLGIDVRRVLWRRVLDMNDRSLRHTVIGMGGVFNGVPRQSGFDITAASEVMAALCLAESHDDLRTRLGRMIVALTTDGAPVTAADLDAVGAMLVLLKDALRPNVVQTGEGVPAIVHGGPFANIAHGCNSVVATKLALGYSDWVVTEAGFGFDLGGEKFFDLKCASADLDTAAVVLVATVRALKLHGGVSLSSLADPDPGAVERGLPNLMKHVENIEAFGEGPVVALNRFSDDTDAEVDAVRRACEQRQLPFAVCEGYAAGGAGAVELAETVMQHAERHSKPFTPLYDWADPVKTKLEKVARTMYGADSIVWEYQAEKDLDVMRRCCGEGLPLCVAKTQSSLSDDPRKLGRPEGFEMTVNAVVVAAGAGYVVPVLGNMQRMPGLSASPQAERMDLQGGRITGVS